MLQTEVQNVDNNIQIAINTEAATNGDVTIAARIRLVPQRGIKN